MRAGLKTERKITRSGWLSAAFAVALSLAVGAPHLAFVQSAYAQGAASTEEAALNPYGDPWSLAEPNPSLALAGATGCYRKPAKGMDHTFSAEELQFQAAMATPFVFEGCAVIIEDDPPVVSDGPSGDTAGLKARVAQFRQANPSEKFIGYFDFSKWESAPAGYRKMLKEHPEWFVFKKGAAKGDMENRLKLRRGNGFIPDVTNPDYQDFIVREIVDGLVYYGMDGLLADNVHSAPRLDEGDEALLPESVRDGWAEGEVAILTKLKQQIPATTFLFANVSRDEKEPFRKAVLNVVDGLMVEDGFSPVSRPLDPEKGRLAGTLRTYDLAAEAGKYVLVTANTLVDGSKFGATSAERERAFARYYLAAHLIFMKGKVFLLYNPPSAVQPQYGAEAFFSDWNINVGSPKGSYAELADYVYERKFENAVVYLNSSDAPYEITATEGYDLAPDGNAVTAVTLQPKSGLILSSPRALQ